MKNIVPPKDKGSRNYKNYVTITKYRCKSYEIKTDYWNAKNPTFVGLDLGWWRIPDSNR